MNFLHAAKINLNKIIKEIEPQDSTNNPKI